MTAVTSAREAPVCELESFRWWRAQRRSYARGTLTADHLKLLGPVSDSRELGLAFDTDLRHTCASLAISAGANVKVLQTLLGHKTATLTLERYGHLFPDDPGRIADAFRPKTLSV